MSINTATGSVSSQLMLDAAEWRLLALLFARPVAGWASQVSALACEVRDDRLRAAAAAAQNEASQGLYDTTFGPGGPAAPREISYRTGLDAGSFLSELTGFYAAFAYQRDEDEPPDHIATEADFIGYLKLKELFARARGLDEEADIVSQSAVRFVEDHLTLIAELLASALERSGTKYLALAASSLLSRVGPRRHFDMATADGLPGELGETLGCGCIEL